MKNLILTFLFTTSSFAIAEAKHVDCWAFADSVENFANGGKGATYKSFDIWEAAYTYCESNMNDNKLYKSL